MEDPPEDASPAAAATVGDGASPGEALEASDEAIEFLSSIEPDELQKCVFLDSLVTESEAGKQVGSFSVTMEFGRRFGQPCVRLHAQSQGVLDNSPCGTTVTAYMTTNLDVLEEDYHEYVKLKGQTLQKKFHMVQRDEQMMINKVITKGEEVTEESVSYPMSALRGLVTEGSTLLLMRLIILRKTMPQNMTFISFKQGSHVVHMTFSELGVKQMDIGGETVDVFGMERTVHCAEDGPATWQCYFLEDGHLASRVHVGSPVTARILEIPVPTEKGFEKTPLVWQKDIEMSSNFLERKVELRVTTCSYLRKHPEVHGLTADFLQMLLMTKPDDVFQFASDYFLPYATRQPPDSDQVIDGYEVPKKMGWKQSETF